MSDWTLNGTDATAKTWNGALALAIHLDLEQIDKADVTLTMPLSALPGCGWWDAKDHCLKALGMRLMPADE